MGSRTRTKTRLLALALAVVAAVGTSDPLWSEPAHAAGQWVRTEDTSGTIAFRRSWRSATSAAASDGGLKRSRRRAAFSQLRFTGTAVRWVGPRRRSGGIATVYLDGARVARVDTYARRASNQRVLFSRTGLAPGRHKIRVTVTGRRNRSATNGYVSVDAFDVIPTTVTRATNTLLADGFESFGSNESWRDGSRHGNWLVRYGGFGMVGTATDGTVVHRQAPLASTDPDETHAGLVTTTKDFSNFTAAVRTKTVRQLRTPRPNAWETAWVLWNYTHDERFYYFIAKPNGWELGKVDNSPADPSNPAGCVWPSYSNCKYEGAQRYLATSNTPTFPVGQWYTIKVTQIGDRMIVSVDGQKVVDFTDRENPYNSGKLGLYNEDALVHFDDVRVVRAS